MIHSVDLNNTKDALQKLLTALNRLELRVQGISPTEIPFIPKPHAFIQLDGASEYGPGMYRCHIARWTKYAPDPPVYGLVAGTDSADAGYAIEVKQRSGLDLTSTPQYRAMLIGVNGDGRPVFEFEGEEPSLSWQWVWITAASPLSGSPTSAWEYTVETIAWNGSAWAAYPTGSPLEITGVLNTYEYANPSAGVYTNGVASADLSGTTIVPQPIRTGFPVKLWSAPIYDPSDANPRIVTEFSRWISEPNGMSGGCE